MTDGDQPVQLQSEAGQQDRKLPELTTCAKCEARLSEILPSCPECGEGVARERRETVPTAPRAVTVDPSSVFTVRYMVLQQLAERNEPTYASTIAKNVLQYGITKERVLKELDKLMKSKYRLVRRAKSTLSRRYLYTVTEAGVKALEYKKGIATNRTEPMIESLPLDPYLWLLENMAEPKSVDDLKRLRNDSEKTLSVYLSQLFKLGVIDRYKQPEVKQVSQRDRNGRTIMRSTTVHKTYYVLRPGPLRDKLAEASSMLPKAPQTFKIEMPMQDLKEPRFTQEMEKEYETWRETMNGKFEEFHKLLISRANKCQVAPRVIYRITFYNLKTQGKI